jgi:hypothetical protein
MKEKIINWLIKVTKADTNKISDGYHTFEQLYEHRIKLWIALLKDKPFEKVWRSERHSDGSVWKGWFILGYGKKQGEQLTYHLPIKYYVDTKFAETLDKAPEYDGHTPEDVLERLKKL